MDQQASLGSAEGNTKPTSGEEQPHATVPTMFGKWLYKTGPKVPSGQVECEPAMHPHSKGQQLPKLHEAA